MNRESKGRSSGIPHLAKNERDTQISCARHQATTACAAFIEESRVRLVNANKPHRKSGGMGHPSLVARETVLNPSARLLSLIGRRNTCSRDTNWQRRSALS